MIKAPNTMRGEIPERPTSAFITFDVAGCKKIPRSYFAQFNPTVIAQ
jgi:hypothetical protein